MPNLPVFVPGEKRTSIMSGHSQTHCFRAFSVASPTTHSAPLGIVLTAAGILAMRMLGLFMVIPVLTLFLAADPDASQPLLVGLVLGGYGLTQALLQIPLGWLSDRVGRRTVIAGGLLVFIGGSLLAAAADNLTQLLIGRLLQGAGAVSGVVMALVGDASPPRWRSLSMALVGMAMGGAFLLSLVVGPLLGGWGLPLSGYFQVAAVMGGVSLLLTWRLPALPPRAVPLVRRDVWRILSDARWRSWNANVFVIHLLIAGSFVALPLLLREKFDLPLASHAMLYLGTLVIACLWSLPLLAWIERRWSDTAAWPVAALLLVSGLAVLVLAGSHVSYAWAGLILFFAGFNMLEAGLPAGVSRRTEAGNRGLVMGVFASHQFLGAFAGGLLGGAMLALGGPPLVLYALLALAVLWALLTVWSRDREMPDEYVFDAGVDMLGHIGGIRDELLALPGVRGVRADQDSGAIVVRFERSTFRAGPVWDVLERAGEQPTVGVKDGQPVGL